MSLILVSIDNLINLSEETIVGLVRLTEPKCSSCFHILCLQGMLVFVVGL